MKLSAIIINYNSFHLTSDCIRSVISYTKDISYETILVDNASTKSDPGKFLEEFPGISLIRSAVNGGFAYGNNFGIEKSTGEYILLRNSDTVLKEESIFQSLGYLRNNKAVGVLG